MWSRSTVFGPWWPIEPLISSEAKHQIRSPAPTDHGWPESSSETIFWGNLDNFVLQIGILPTSGSMRAAMR